jgi:hypothetical protein
MGVGKKVGRVKRGGLRRSGFVRRGCCYGESALSVSFCRSRKARSGVRVKSRGTWRESVGLAATPLYSYQTDEATSS